MFALIWERKITMIGIKYLISRVLETTLFDSNSLMRYLSTFLAALAIGSQSLSAAADVSAGNLLVDDTIVAVGTEGTGSIPEPGVGVLALLGSLIFLRRRRR